jgi:hypothetical protein
MNAITHPITVLELTTKEQRNQLRHRLEADLTQNGPGEPVIRPANLVGFPTQENLGPKRQLRLQPVQEEELGVRTFESEVLKNTGIIPIATLPAKLWKDFCRTCGLYRFEHINEQGQTGVQDTVPEFRKVFIYDEGIREICLAVCWVAFIFGLFGFFICTTESSSIGHVNPPLLIMFIAMFLLGLVAIANGSRFSTFCSRFRRPEIHERERKSWEANRLQTYWPKQVDTNPDGTEYRVVVNFPTPPEHFLAQLEAAKRAGYRLCVAVTPEAIGFGQENHCPGAEPILYVQSGNGKYVCLLGQFGDFPNNERAVALAQQCAEKYIQSL